MLSEAAGLRSRRHLGSSLPLGPFAEGSVHTWVQSLGANRRFQAQQASGGSGAEELGGCQSPVSHKVSVLRLVIKSLISEAKVCLVFCRERRKKEPAAAGRLHGCSRCPGTLRGRGNPGGKGTPQGLLLVPGFSGKAAAWGSYWDNWCRPEGGAKVCKSRL